MTTSKCVAEYRKYFITLAEIRRSYQETYLGWVIEQYKTSKLTSEQKMDNLVSSNQQLVSLNQIQSNQLMHMQNNLIIRQNVSLHMKVDSIFNMMLSFMQTTIPTWIGGSVMQNHFFIY